MKKLLFTLLSALVFAGCNSARTASTSTVASPMTCCSPMTSHGGMGGGSMAEMKANCPMMVSGTTASYEEVADGGALVFRTTGNVADLRSRVAAMARMHNMKHGGSAPQDEGRMRGPASTATSLVSNDGARLIFTPTAGTDRQTLRDSVRTHADQMKSGTCPLTII